MDHRTVFMRRIVFLFWCLKTSSYSKMPTSFESTNNISYYRLFFWFFLLYTGCVPLELVDSAAILLSSVKTAVEGDK
jgi:hypothetical protein